jgi:hypothetical protein
MPRVYTQKKNRAGSRRACGRCGKEIKPGEKYYSYSFRYGGTHYRCADHWPKRSELTQSKASEVFSAIEGCEAELDGGLDTIDDIRTAVESVAEVARDVAAEYEEAAEYFGGEGENRERADMAEQFADECESFEPDEVEPEGDEPTEEETQEALEAAANDARDVLGNCEL